MGGIYLIQENGELVEMTEQPYDSEDLLQKLLASYPDVLAGDQFNRAVPRRWLLISREMEIPLEEEGSGRWSLDHLFIDQDAVPTLVEVKRHGDTRIRREVAGQLLDYAANAVVYWPAESIRSRFDTNCQAQGRDPAEVLAQRLGVDDPDAFWRTATINLRAGRVRLVFLADEIPPELQRIVEFLNTQMNPAEVLAVEIRQFVNGKLRTLVPKVIGQTASAPPKGTDGDGGNRPRRWTEAAFYTEFPKLRGADELGVARRIHDWAKQSGLAIDWPKAAKTPAMYLRLDHDGRSVPLAAVSGDGAIHIDFYSLRQTAPFADETYRRRVLEQLNQIPGINVKLDTTVAYPRMPIAALKDEAAFRQFVDVVGWLVEQIRTASAAGIAPAGSTTDQ